MNELLQNRFVKGLLWFAPVVFVVLAVSTTKMSGKMPTMIVSPQPQEMALEQSTPKDVIGNLGGMKVRIPWYYAEYVEYDGDAGFDENLKVSHPERTFDSRLTSFGIDARFPDMKGLKNAQLHEERHQQHPHEKMWICIAVRAGEIYPGDGFLDRRINEVLVSSYSPNRNENLGYAYERIPEDKYGLEAWRLMSANPHAGNSTRNGNTSKDIYIHRGSSGNVSAYITCERPSATRIGKCYLETSFAPKAQVDVTISFWNELLPEWEKILQSVYDLFLSFEVDPVSIKI